MATSQAQAQTSSQRHGNSRRRWVLGALSIISAAVMIVTACVPPAPPSPDEAAGSVDDSPVLPDDTPPDSDNSSEVYGDPLLPEHLDCNDSRYSNTPTGELPEEWDVKDYRFTSERDPGLRGSPQHLCGQLGAAVDLAWGIEHGMPEVVIAVLDSGIDWQRENVQVDLAPTTYLNRGELPVPISPHPAPGDDPYDVNGDGRFSIEDYADDPRVWDRNENEVLDPEDLILTPEFNNGVDDDGNGYIDDISGWDFLFNDNNPFDDVGYGHGSGEARDAAAAHNGEHAYGVCPDCSHLPVRVSDSFMADGGRFAAGVLFAVDSGASVVLEALGGITNPVQAQQAITAAYERGIPVVASMADEQSQHANLPAALNHTMPVNSVTEAFSLLGSLGSQITGQRDTLALNGCTNFGAITWVAVPSDGCSSEATGNAAGMMGLVQAAARRSGVAPHPDVVARHAADHPGRTFVGNVLSANEAAQLFRTTADDVDFSTPNDVNGPNETKDAFGQERYPTVRGWDATFGYGRTNTYEAVAAVVRGDIPPEADITSPRWFELSGIEGQLAVEGHVGAVRSASYTYRVEWTTGLQAPPYPGVDDWRVVKQSGTLTQPFTGTLATLDLAEIAAALPDGGTGVPLDDDGIGDPDRFTARVRVVVTDQEGRVGTYHRHFHVHDDPTLTHQQQLPSAGMSSPVFVNLDDMDAATNDGAASLLFGSDDGAVSILDATGAMRPGFPVHTAPAMYWPTKSPTARAAGITAPGAAIGVGAPAIGDLAGDDALQIVVADLDGHVHVWDTNGVKQASMSIDPRFSQQAATDQHNRVKRGIMSSPALGDLDGDGDLEIVVAALDRHVYAWHHDGATVDGFPVLVVDPRTVAAVDEDSHQVTFKSPENTGIGGELIATPAIGDINGDGRPEIVVGGQEQYIEAVGVFPSIGVPGMGGNTRLYAIHPDGTKAPQHTAPGVFRDGPHPHENAYLKNWPVQVPMLMTDVLPTIGGGIATQAAIGDVNGDGHVEVVTASAGGQVMVFSATGRTTYSGMFDLPIGLDWFGVAPNTTNSDDVDVIVSAFSGPTLARSAHGDQLDIAVPTSGARRAIDMLLANAQGGHQHVTMWNGATGKIYDTFPRRTSDLAFFVSPGRVDLNNDGHQEVVSPNGLFLIDAFDMAGTQPDGWPKLTGGWVVGTPGVGDWGGTGQLNMAVIRRDGTLLVWDLNASPTARNDWPRFGGNHHNTGSIHIDR